MSPEIAADVFLLWQSDAVQKAYSRRSEFWILDGADYYFGRCRDFAAKGFAPSEEDIIMARARTTGIILTEFASDNVSWVVVDVGGQRSERKKWINCFDDVKAVLFVVNLSGYSSVLFEDEKRNRMHEAMDLFEQVAAEKVFLKTPIFLFFNKKDLFEERLKVKPLKECFPNYDGKGDTKSALDFIAGQFLARVTPKREGPAVMQWPIAARFKKDVQFAFMELKEKLLTQNKTQIAKALAALKKDEEKRAKKGKKT